MLSSGEEVSGEGRGNFCMNAIYHLQAEVRESAPLGANYHRLVLQAPQIVDSARPGQFVHLAPPATAETLPLLRRPISISGIRPAAGCIELTFCLIGPGTRLLAIRRPGETLDCLGPLGNGFTLQSGKLCLLIAGGMGIAPLRWLAAELAAKNNEVHLLAGAKSPEDFPGPLERQKDRLTLPELEALGIHTEFVSEKDHLLVTDLLARRLPEVLATGRNIQAYAVGPRAMFKALLPLLPENVPCQVSLEERMACGVGACRSCVVALRDLSPVGSTYKRVCRDGPVFDIREVVWDM